MDIARILFASTLMLLSAAAAAEDFDGSKPLICASVDAYSCVSGQSCVAASAEELNVPEFFRINFAEKTVSAKRPDGQDGTTEIQTFQVHEGELVLQGTQGGRGWTAAITQGSGKMALSAVGDRIAFVIFGACTPLE